MRNLLWPWAGTAPVAWAGTVSSLGSLALWGSLCRATAEVDVEVKRLVVGGRQRQVCWTCNSTPHRQVGGLVA